ncbi:MAG TPA: tRNA (uridine(34)/cytosine(34)/5-carboxymethylaminomethyluridine(34)-2'-O)-methyltransferase TrmL [Bacillota bacterium]|nr:tRNA (uridine(34)/cytosine(34)/5-carboxymethylaminomethyluridine(34)-2'-O)-methyltransferase TrmL [Bacillota bacterium]
MAIHIVLYQPEIPANTGNIARTCVATNATLHLIHPLGFEITDKRVKRAGLDYWKYLNIREYEHIDELFSRYERGVFYFVEDYGEQYYTDVDFKHIEEDIFLVFGQETNGIPETLLQQAEEHCIKVPMGSKVRSLNLSNTVAIVLYEVLRQKNFPILD